MYIKNSTVCKATLKIFGCFFSNLTFANPHFSTFRVGLTVASKRQHFFRGSNFRENGQKSRKTQNFLPTKLSPRKVQHKHLYSIKSSLKFVYSRIQSQYLYLILQTSHFLSSCPYLHLIL